MPCVMRIKITFRIAELVYCDTERLSKMLLGGTQLTMAKRRFLLVILIVLALSALVGGAFAQTEPDADGDGVPDRLDQCDNQPGPRENNGCPRDASGSDRDGDGVLDFADQCPDEAGTGFTQGCPTSAQQTLVGVPTPAPTLVPIYWIDIALCLVASQNPAPINVRETANPNAQVIGFLEEGDQVEGIGAGSFDGVVWYNIKGFDANPNITGWVSTLAFGLVVSPLCEDMGIVWSTELECVAAVPFSIPSVNVHADPTFASPVIGSLPAGFQFEPWFRDYDENNDYWLAGSIGPGGTEGWVYGPPMAMNAQCVYLPQVIHADAPSQDPIMVEFDPDLIPPHWNPFDDDDSDRPQIGRGGIVVIDPDLLFPQIPEITPEPQATPYMPEIPDGDPWVPLIMDQLFGDGDDSGFDPQPDPPTDPFRFVRGGEDITPTDRMIIAVLPPDADAQGAPIFMILPKIGDGEGECPAEQFVHGMVFGFQTWGDPHVGDPTWLAGLDLSDQALMGLLLPAVQKIREAAAHGDGSVMLGDGSVRPGDGSVMPGDGSVVPECAIIAVTPMITDGTLQGYQSFGLLLPAVQQ